MMVIDHIKALDGRKRFIDFQKDYDDLFQTVIEYHLRAIRGGIILDNECLDGVAGQELHIKGECCRDMYIKFVYMVSNALNPTYILAVLKNHLLEFYCRRYEKNVCLPVSRECILLLLLEISLVGEAGVLPKAKMIADLSITLCSPEMYNFCCDVCDQIRVIEERLYS